MDSPERRRFLKLAGSSALLAAGFSTQQGWAADSTLLPRFGMVTYQWGKDWDLPTLIRHCEAAEVEGVELRATHAHGVEPELSAAAREEVRKRFADSSVVCVGPGSDERFDSPDPAVLKKSIERTKAFLELSHDIGATGVKVKPNDFHKEVPREKTIAQIAAALREVAEFGQNLGQLVRLEVHGQLAPPEVIVQVMEACDHQNARLCWNCNDPDIESGGGFAANFDLARPWFGDTLHFHDLDGKFRPYPYPELFAKLVATKYSGWCLLESSTKREDPVAALKEQRKIFRNLISEKKN
ncbi:MAG: sugar phosphate isomerase/epimerase [Verrucomicrobiae bacterium]|nr:sugar phosphate isomerase/epimerase [Verrucomicrobiae bacterium]MCP5539814.1 sugar phosphate isomerase/epimerase [Akkermansiaceae bacterium]